MHDFLPTAVDSVAAQDCGDVELIIVDDGSDRPVNTDLFASYSITIEFFVIDHGGKPKAVNKGFEHASGDYITILDADDRLPEDSLSKRAERLQDSGADLCIGSFEVYYNGHSQSKRDIRSLANYSNRTVIRHLLNGIIAPLHQNAMLFRRDLLEKVGGMDSAMLRGQDKDFAIRLLQNSIETRFIEDPVYIYNRYDRSLKNRITNRLTGMRYKLILIGRYFSGWRCTAFLAWGVAVEVGKLIHDLFGIYKK
jgi:glycosyltransferase involved in cell wall biosynthesis